MASFEWPPGLGGGGGGGSDPAIGGPITNGTANSVLFVNPDAIIDQDNANLNYNAGTTIFTANIIKESSLTASTALVADATKTIISSVTTLAELAFVHGVTSNIQTQLNGKQATLTIGDLTDAGTDGIVITGGAGAVIGSGTSLAQHVADATHNGYLSSTDWTTFNNKGSGTVTAVSVASANGFAGSSSGGATPALTLTTTVTGILQGNGTAISAASTTGSGAVVLATSPTLVTPALGTPASGVATNLTGLPLTAGVTGVLPIANGGTNNGSLSVSAGAAFYADGSKVVALAPGSAGQLYTSGGTGAPTWTSFVAPTQQIFTSGSGTYTTPTSPRTPLYLKVQMVGGGGGCGGVGTSGSGSGGTGGTSTFGSNLSCVGGVGGGGGNTTGGVGGTGGVATITGATGINGFTINGGNGGGSGSGASATESGPNGGSTPFGGNGGGGQGGGNAGTTGATNSGAGAGGVSGAGTFAASGAGGGGSYIEATISGVAIASTFTYAVGAVGSAGGGGAGGGAGTAGAAGRIIVTEYYQ